MRFGRVVSGLVLAAGMVLLPAAGSASASAATPKLDHVFLIMEENNGFSDVIGNPAAPNLNHLANTFGLETDYFGLSQDSSETNYAGLLSGSTNGVTSDDAYWKNVVDRPSLISQLDRAGVSWKAYLQALPYAGYQGICYPAKCNGAPDNDPLYVSKHDTIQNFTTSWNAADWSRQVPIGELASDLHSGDVPRFSYIVPDECHDMHGDPPYCLDSGNIKDPQNQHLVAVGDAYLGHLVSEITSAGSWAKGNNAIVVTFDNGDTTQGCCDAKPGGGPVATIVITSHGPRGVTDSTPANHYSLLSTFQHNFGLGCLGFTCDTAVRGQRLHGDRHQAAAGANLANADALNAAGAGIALAGHHRRGRLEGAAGPGAWQVGQQPRRDRGLLAQRHLGGGRLPAGRGQFQPGRDARVRRAL